MKKVFLSLITIFMVLSLSIVLVKAEGETVSIDLIDGVQIRTDANAGLKWVAKLEKPNADYEYGFLFAQGEVANLDKDTLNVEKYVVEGVTAESTTIAATMTKFPKAAVAKDITVRAYFKNENDEYTYSNIVVRNLAEVAIYAKNSLDGTFVNAVVEYVDSNYMKTYNIGNTKYVVKPIYEYEPTELAKEFIKDWNNVMGQSIDTMSGWAGVNKNGQSDSVSKDVILNTNIYKFFNNDEQAMLAKWGWLLDYICEATGNEFAMTQAKYIKGEKEIADSNNADWYGSQHLISRIENFFTRKGATEGLSYQSSHFTTNNEYANLIATIEALPKKVYSTVDCEFVKIGSSIQLLDKPTISNGYAWDGFTANESIYEANSDYVVTNETAVFTPTTHAIAYTITYKDGEEVIESLEPLNYNIATATFTLPKYSKEGYLFKGWYSDSELTQEVTQVTTGSYGDKVFYAKFEAGYFINYNYNGGFINYGSKADVVADLFADLSAYKGNKVTPTSMACYSSAWSLNNFYKFFQDENYGAKWLWLVELFAEKETTTSVKNGILYLLGQKSWDSNYAYAVDYVICAFGNNYKYTKNANYKTYDYSLLEDSVVVEKAQPTQVEVSGLGTVTQLPTLKTNKKGYEFVGWYDNQEFEGALLTEVTNNVNLYAKFALANYSITFNCGEGQSLVNLPSQYTIESETITLPLASEMSIENGKFIGWFTNENCTGDPVTEITKGSFGNVTLYAGWLMNQAKEVELSAADKVVLDSIEPTIVVSNEFGLGKYNVNGVEYETGINAFSTLAEAVAVLNENDIVYVFAGTYNDVLTISIANVTLVGPNANIAGSSAQRTAEALFTGTIEVKANNVTINGFHFGGNDSKYLTETYSGNSNKAKNIIHSNVSNFTFEYNYVTAGRVFLELGVTSNTVIENNFFNWTASTAVAYSYWRPIRFDGLTSNLAFKNNKVVQSVAGNGDTGFYDLLYISKVSGELNILNNDISCNTYNWVFNINNAANATVINVNNNILAGATKNGAGFSIKALNNTANCNIIGNTFKTTVSGTTYSIAFSAPASYTGTVKVELNAFNQATYKPRLDKDLPSVNFIHQNNYIAATSVTSAGASYMTITLDNNFKTQAELDSYIASLK